jgi:uncharacterized cupredoxin-like copper-binding protein
MTPTEEMTSTEGSPEISGVVAVSLVDGTIEMPASLPAEPVIFKVTNNGTEEHGFEIEDQGEIEGNLRPGETGSLELDLPAGEYRVYCPVDDHAANGMELTLTVE